MQNERVRDDVYLSMIMRSLLLHSANRQCLFAVPLIATKTQRSAAGADEPRGQASRTEGFSATQRPRKATAATSMLVSWWGSPQARIRSSPSTSFTTAMLPAHRRASRTSSLMAANHVTL